MAWAEREDKNFFPHFRDTVLAVSQTRGAEVPIWDDVVVAMAAFPLTHEVLTGKKVSTHGLERDVLYSLHFGRPRNIAQVYKDWSTKTLDQQIRTELMHDLEGYAQQLNATKDPNTPFVANQLLEFVNRQLEEQESSQGNRKKKDHVMLRHELVAKRAQAMLENIQSTPTSRKVDYDKYDAKRTIIDGFTKFVHSKEKLIRTEEDPLVYLEKSVPYSGMTPYSMVGTITDVVDPFLQYTLHRNGMIAPDDYEPPCKMPHPTIISQGISALELATHLKDKQVTPAHLLTGLLVDREIMLAINDLDTEGNLSDKDEPDPFMMMFGGKPGRNFIKFHLAIKDAIAPDDNDERFRFVPKVTPEIKTFLESTENVVGKGPERFSNARMFIELIKDEHIRGILKKAGLTDDQLNALPAKLEERSQKEEEEEKRIGKKKTEDGPKVDDRTLEGLLEEYASDRSKLALEGKLDPLIGREDELHQIMRILLQRGKSNPLLLGEPGVGKTALFDGLAQYIASGRAPKALIGARVITLDLSAMNSGAIYRGQFEGRLLPIVQGVAERNAKKDKPPIILCIDEVHSALMAGTADGTPGAGELLKPYLTKGELSIIGATTQADFAKHIEPDHALVRRFQPIFIEQPKEPEATDILKGLKEKFTGHHEIEVPDELLGLMVRLTNRYLPNLQQPDKGISILDAACARAKMAGNNVLDRETLLRTIAAEAKIDPKFLTEDDKERYLGLQDELPKQVLGQDFATRRVASALVVAKADLNDPRKPLGSFLLLGPTGVGKTETGRGLARLLHGSEEALIRIDMSDFQERHEASKLVGAPPGFVGYGEEGRVTGAVRRKPYSVVMLDEIEKAHPEVLKRFLPVLEEGEILDGRNQRVSFRNSVVLMSSNLGVREATAKARAERLDPHFDPDGWREATQPIYEAVLKATLPPELINRLDGWFVYNPLPRSVIEQLVDREVATLSSRVADKYGLPLAITDELRRELAQLGYNPEYGARELKRTIRDHVITPLSGWLLRLNGSTPITGAIRVGLNGNGIYPEIVGSLT